MWACLREPIDCRALFGQTDTAGRCEGSPEEATATLEARYDYLCSKEPLQGSDGAAVVGVGCAALRNSKDQRSRRFGFGFRNWRDL